MEAGWIALLSVLNFIYIAIGGICFSYLENGQEEPPPTDVVSSVLRQLAENETCISYQRVQAALLAAVSNLSSTVAGVTSSDFRVNWSKRNSMFFASTVVTTIGYGNMSPATSQGQLFFIFYAILGIPLMLVLLANVGVHINNANRRLANSINCFKNPKMDLLTDTIVICSLGVTLFVLVPAGVFHYIEDWGYVTSCYFAVVTLSTVGFGDYVAGSESDTLYRILVTLWVMIGLAWFAGIVNNIQSKLQKGLHRHEVDVDLHTRGKHQSKLGTWESEETCKPKDATGKDNGGTSMEPTSGINNTDTST